MKKITFLLFVVFFIIKVNAQNWNEITKVVASDRAAYDQFGWCVSNTGNYAIVGANWEDEDANGGNTIGNAGAAYIFERDAYGNWNQTQKIVASVREICDEFGCSVSISGNYAIIGAKLEDEDATEGNPKSNSGSSYIFERDSSGDWNQVQKIIAFDRDTGDYFGFSVCINGNFAIVGSYYESEDTYGGNTLNGAGSAYIFEKGVSGYWNQVQKIVACDRDAGDYFGGTVSISANYAIVGAGGEDEDALGGNTFTSSGSAYIFERDTSGNWTQIQKIVASDRATGDNFGASLSIYGNYIIVGAQDDDEDASGSNTLYNSGSAYIFERDSNGYWNEVQKIVASDRNTEAFFGRVSISDKYAVVGAPGGNKDANGGNYLSNAGSAYIFKRGVSGNWNQVQKIVASDRDSWDIYAATVSISGNSIIVATYAESEDATGGNTMISAGSAYFYEFGTIGISENDIGSSFIVHPNPTTGIITVDLGKIYPEIEIGVRNILGQLILSRSFKTAKMVDLEINEVSGLYFIEMKTKEGLITVVKVLKE
ncbi:T9SS type A sorting domain-containing protein [candidate division KSB1 bacterium]